MASATGHPGRHLFVHDHRPSGVPAFRLGRRRPIYTEWIGPRPPLSW